MRRVSADAAAQAAKQATDAAVSEAARVLASQKQQKVEAPKVEAPVEPKAEVKSEEKKDLSLERIDQLRKANPRNKIMEELEKRDLERKGVKEEPKEESKEAPQPPVEEAKTEEAPPVVAEAPKEPEAPKTVKVKVDGEEFDAPAEEVEQAGGVKAYQMLKAGENRLKKANETVAESKKLTAQLVELLNKRQEPEQPKVSDDEFIKSKVDVIRFGTPEESATALKEILLRAQPKQVDQAAIIGQALQAIDRKQATAEFGSKFPEIISNPLLVKLAISLEQEEIAKAQKDGRAVDWKATYDKIGTQIRSVAPSRQSQPPATTEKTAGTTSQPSEKEARKASITNLPTASARAELPKEEKPETREDVLNEMRKSRRIPVG